MRRKDSASSQVAGVYSHKQCSLRRINLFVCAARDTARQKGNRKWKVVWKWLSVKRLGVLPGQKTLINFVIKNVGPWPTFFHSRVPSGRHYCAWWQYGYTRTRYVLPGCVSESNLSPLDIRYSLGSLWVLDVLRSPRAACTGSFRHRRPAVGTDVEFFPTVWLPLEIAFLGLTPSELIISTHDVSLQSVSSQLIILFRVDPADISCFWISHDVVCIPVTI